MSTVPSPAVAVTLVHGTIPAIGPIHFKPSKDWTASDAPVSHALSNIFPSAVISCFPWTGKNSHRARVKASSDLAEHLSQQHKVAPQVTQLVLAHSHGGNVCLYALSLLPPEVKRNIVALVCLGTPFLVCVPRDVETQRGRLGICILLGMIVWVGIWAFTHFDSRVLVIVVLGAIAAVRFLLAPIDRWRQIAAHCERQLTAEADPNISLLCMNVTRDEARIWLRALDGALLVVKRAWAWVMDSPFSVTLRNPFALLTTAEDLGEGMGGGMGCAFMLMAMLSFFGALAISISLSAINFVVLIVLSLIALVTRAAPWGFGEGWLLHWTVEIRSQNTPITPATRPRPERETAGLIVLDIASSSGTTPSSSVEVKDWGLKGFRHSAICWDQECARFTADWFAARIHQRTETG